MAEHCAREPQREVLPIPDRPYAGTVVYDARDLGTKFPAIVPTRPPIGASGAPNILLVLLDDVGFGATSAFGGPCVTRTAERLAAGGLSYTRFHTTGLCSPTRAALLTGRNHHTVGMGGITEIATAAPGYTSAIPNSAANIGKILSYNGYSTGYFGKCHEVPTWEWSAAGPFDHWPTRSGFDRFYGFVGGETSQWYPEVYEGTARVTIPDDPEYHFMADMTDQAIRWIQLQRSLAPDRPFFAYFAPGAAHAPHHVPKEWADRYKGQFDDGWDALRARIIEQQKRLGVIPEEAKLTARPAEIPSWEDMPQRLWPVLAREMEVYAGFLEYTDHHVGRLIEAIEELGILDDTLVIYILGDNGASAEGTFHGTFNETINFNGMAALETPELLLARMDELGGRNAYNHYSVGWAHALDTPYQWTKQVASHWGGTRNGMIIRWPRGIWSQAEDLSKELPEKLHELQRLWLIEAARHNVLPLDDRAAERVDPEIAGRPQIARGPSQRLYDGMEITSNAVLDTKNRSHAITAKLTVPEGGARGVIYAEGTQFGGYALYAHEGRLKYVYNFLGLDLYAVESSEPLLPGEHEARMELAYDGGGLGKGGTVTLFVDGAEVARGRVEHTHPVTFSLDTSAMVGDKRGAPVSPDLKPSGNRWSGSIAWVQIDVGAPGADLPTNDNARIRAAMAAQ